MWARLDQEDRWLVPLLEDLRENGAASVEDIERYLRGCGSPCSVEDLAALGEIAPVPTDLGTVYVLGPRGKRRLGVRSAWRTRPEVALEQLLARRVRAVLEAAGWRRDGTGSLPIPRYRREDGRAAYVLVKARGPRSRSVRRMLAEYRTQLIREGAVLVIFTPDRGRLAHLEEDSNGLLSVRSLEPERG
jgi:hypothetical protein